MIAADSLQFADLVEALLVTSLEEFTYRKNDVDLGCTGTESQSRFCHFDLEEALRAWENAADASDIEFRVVERTADIFGHSGIDADSGYVGNTRKLFLKRIDGIGHLLHLSNGIVGAKRGVVNLVEALFPDLDIVVLGKMICQNICYLSLDLLIVERAGILREQFFKLIHNIVDLKIRQLSVGETSDDGFVATNGFAYLNKHLGVQREIHIHA